MADKAIAAFEDQEVFAEDLTQTIYMNNDGIPADFLVDETYLAENQQGNEGPDHAQIRLKSFIRCLRGFELSDSQIEQIKRDLRMFKGCTEQAVKRAKAIYQELKQSYRIKYHRLYLAFQDGSITKEEFRMKVKELRVAFKRELHKLQLREKLAGALHKCIRGFFTGLHEVLSERQWNSFVECYMP